MKRLFTLIEVLLVILIIGILLSIFSSLNFNDEREEILKAHGCINIVVGKVSNYVNSAFTAKGIYTGGNDIFPFIYIIDIQPKYNIYLKYFDGITGTFANIDLKSLLYKQKGCEGVYFSGKSYKILLYSGLEPDISRGGFEIYYGSTKVYTGEEYFYFNLTGYRPRLLGKIYIDSRAKKIFYYSCEIWSGGDLFSCLKRR